MRTNGPLARNRDLHFAAPDHRMSGLKVEVGPVVLNPDGGVMHGVKAARRRFGRRAVGRQPSVFVRPRHRNRTRRVFVIALPLARLFRQIQKHTVAIGIRDSGETISSWMRLRANGPSVPIAWAKAISVGPGIRTKPQSCSGPTARPFGFRLMIDRIHANGWAVGPHGKWVLIDLARRYAVGQAMRTNGPLARNRKLHSTPPRHGMCCFEIAAWPVLLNPCGGIVDRA